MPQNLQGAKEKDSTCYRIHVQDMLYTVTSVNEQTHLHLKFIFHSHSNFHKKIFQA